jgi:hypothetical protein
MHEHRLTVASVLSVPGMLGHIGIDNKAMRRWIAEAKRFLSLNFA